MDVSDVKAGRYELVAESWDERTSKLGEPFTYKRHRRGDILNLDEADAKRLVKAGAVVEPGSLQKAAAAKAEAQYRALLAQVPDHLRDLGVQHEPSDEEAEQDADGDGQEGGHAGGSGSDGGAPPASATPERPASVEAKGVWVDYVVARAAQLGRPVDREELAKLTKEKVIAAADALDKPPA